MQRKTIPTQFDKSALPAWARRHPAVVERCQNSLEFRADVHRATTWQLQRLLIADAKRAQE